MPCSFSGTQQKSLLSCLLLAIELWFDSSLCRSLSCPLTRCNWNISSSYIYFSFRHRRKLSEWCRGFCQRRNLLLSWSQPPSALLHTPCRAGGSSGCCCSPRDPSCRTQQDSMLGVEKWLILLWKILSSREQLAGLKRRFRLLYSTLLIRLSI